VTGKSQMSAFAGAQSYKTGDRRQLNNIRENCILPGRITYKPKPMCFSRLCQVLLVVMLFACAKSHNNQPEDENEIIKNNDAIKTIFITYPIYSPGGFTAIYYIAAYDVSGNLKWKKDSTRAAVDLTYAKGVLAIVTDSSFNTPNGTQYRYSLHGLNAETGNIMWSNQSSPYIHSNTIARNDTLFASCQLITSPYTPFIIGFNLKTGAELFKIPVRDSLAPRFFMLDGRMIYYIARTQHGHSSIVAYDFKSNQEKWQVAVGVTSNGLLISSEIVQNDNCLFVTNGVGVLMAIEKSTGSVRWSKNGGYLQPRFGNNLIFSGETRVGMHALDAKTGDPAWKWETKDGNGLIESVFYGSGHVFFNYSGPGWILTTLNAKTGKAGWERPVRYGPGQPLLVGDKLYFAERLTPSGELLCLDANTGALLKSFPLPGDPHFDTRKMYIVTESGKFLAPDRLY